MPPTRATPDSLRFRADLGYPISGFTRFPRNAGAYPHRPACTSCRPPTIFPSSQAEAGRAGYGLIQGAAIAPLRDGLEEEVQAMRGLSLHTFAGDRRFPIYPYMLRRGM